MKDMWNNFRMFVWLTLVTGIAYPLLVTGVAQVTMQKKADGDFVDANGKVVGAVLIGQKFESDRYFWPRPSAVNYNPLPSGGSNLGPTSEALSKAVKERKEKIVKAHGVKDDQVPSELLFASGSGLDPHITPSTALFQVDRVIKARGLDASSAKQELEALIDQMTLQRSLGFLGEPCVNVLSLNMALDQLHQNQRH